MAVTEVEPGKFTFHCEVPRCGWNTSGWDRQDQAELRGSQHQNEHETGELMPALDVFELSVGFIRGEPVLNEPAVNVDVKGKGA
jgi:hypothetical protein